MNYRLSLFRVLLAVITIVLTGCATSPVKKMEAIAAKAPDAAAYLLDELKTKRIIFIGEDHRIVNEELFLTEHLQEFYDAGVRYFFSEGDMDKGQYLPMYPWGSSGRRVEGRKLSQAAVSLEQATADTDPFKVVVAEEGLALSILGANAAEISRAEWYNYRDERAAKKIIETLDNAPEDAKAICVFGAPHGYKTVEKWTESDGTQNDRIPLGYLLSKRYGSDFISLNFITESRVEDEWKRSISSPKIILPKEVKALKGILYPNHYYYVVHNYYDAFIVDSQTHFGTISTYLPGDDELQFWVQTLKELNRMEISKIEQDSLYLIISYYLKLYYGEHFNYTLWKTPGEEQSASLLQALEALELYAFNESVKPSDMIQFHHSLEDMRLYCENMSYSLIEEVIYGRDMADITETGNIQYLIKAREIFPEDLWTLYWLAFIQTETGSYTEGLANFQELFTNDLSLNMSILPLAYKKAAKSAVALGNTSLAAEYIALSESLYNEYDADPSIGPFSKDAGYHLK